MRLFVIALLAACGNDHGLLGPDAGGGPPGSPSVAVTTPRSGESFYPNQSATVTFTATDDDTQNFSCEVTAPIGASALPRMDVMVTSAREASVAWQLGMTPGPAQVKVACTDANGLTGVGYSGMFAISTPPQAVSFAAQVQPIFTASCNGNACHDANQSAEGLNLTAAASYAELVGKPSGQCGSSKLVDPTKPEASYLVMKLQGSGPCFIGTKMPKATQSLPAAQIQIVRDWIFNGAPNN